MKNLNLISLLSLLLVMSFYRCDKQSDEFISDLDTTSFVEAFLAFVFDQDVEELVDEPLLTYSTDETVEEKDTLTTESYNVEVTREGNIKPTPTRLDRQSNKKEDTSVHKEENEHLED